MINYDDDDDINDPNLLDVQVYLPDILHEKIFKNENSVNLLKIAIVIFNQELALNPMDGFSKIICLRNNKKLEYDFSIRKIIFNPTLDLENTSIVAKLLFNKDQKLDVKLLVERNVVKFFLTGMFTQNSEGDIKTIVIKKLKNHIDVAGYFKKPIKDKSDEFSSLEKQIEKVDWDFKNDTNINDWEKAIDSWKNFRKNVEHKIKTNESTGSSQLTTENFKLWKKMASEMAKKVDNNHSSPYSY